MDPKNHVMVSQEVRGGRWRGRGRNRMDWNNMLRNIGWGRRRRRQITVNLNSELMKVMNIHKAVTKICGNHRERSFWSAFKE